MDFGVENQLATSSRASQPATHTLLHGRNLGVGSWRVFFRHSFRPSIQVHGHYHSPSNRIAICGIPLWMRFLVEFEYFEMNISSWQIDQRNGILIERRPNRWDVYAFAPDGLIFQPENMIHKYTSTTSIHKHTQANAMIAHWQAGQINFKMKLLQNPRNTISVMEFLCAIMFP